MNAMSFERRIPDYWMTGLESGHELPGKLAAWEWKSASRVAGLESIKHFLYE